MVLQRIAYAARLASVAPSRGGLSPAATRWAATYAPVTSPRPLSIRYDSLMVQCTVAAVIYFVPQDLVFLAGLFTAWHNKASTISPCHRQADVETAVEQFKAKKGLESIQVSKGRTWHVALA
eukprot:TRINITY_DN5626_c0_g2_i1.p1 TRINITY_DN5626_c0_g2~~TRINITY_DN5626_c0_g2_i1.p1  ORF type:complete len:122 (+),score=10.46 TRINITY_DN5626_c0_g2_i1:81-446(+)